MNYGFTKSEKKMFFVFFFVLIVSIVVILIGTFYKDNTLHSPKTINVLDSGGNLQNIKESYKDTPFNLKVNVYTKLDNKLDWNKIVTDIKLNYKKYDSFIILCDTELVPYTASILTFMIEDNYKPIIVTDGIQKIEDKDLIYSQPSCISVLYKNKLIKGCKTDFDPYGRIISTSPSERDTGIKMNTIKELSIKYIDYSIKIAVVNIYPNTDIDFLSNISKEYKGVILDLNGTFEINEATKMSLKRLSDRGVVVIGVFDRKENEFKNDTGITICENISVHTSHSKLLFLLSNIKENEIVEQIMAMNIRGEM